ncbi:MAG: tetratricopeptide repeat protein, partial [Planctomycetota bacterium]
KRPWSALLVLVLVVPASVRVTVAGPRDELEEAQQMLATGRYREALTSTTVGVVDEPDEEAWHLLHLRVLLSLGEHETALTSVVAALEEFTRSIELRLLAYEVLRASGDPQLAEKMLNTIAGLGNRYRWRYRDATERVVLGRVQLLLGADAKQVMDEYFRPAKDDEPDLVLPRMAIAELALQKHDYQLAAEELRQALEREPDNADLHHLLAAALATSDSETANQALARALELNPNHFGGLALSIDWRLGGEQYGAAEALVARILALDPGRWEAWAYRAVLAHLDGDLDREQICRDTALERWASNPGVDHLIGEALSKKYRFAEGAAYQRSALKHDAEFLPARFQLAQDLLRLGQEEEGWKLMEAVLADDAYNVVAYNLMVLHDALLEYSTLDREGLVVRMQAREADVYGARVLDLMQEARTALTERYRIELGAPIVLELFAEQKDFAIRTFGLPGGAGFLGVCFGDVVTMNSPASQGEQPSNWEAVLWHEFCHVVTLNKTHNKMPRWLSEGISVYEERRRDPSWGQVMTPAYRARILDGRATPVSALSSAFRQPDGPQGLMFAYYEASLVVEYLVDTHGFDTLLAVLDDLGQGETLERSLARRVAPMDELDAQFDAHLRELAQAFAIGATWEPVEAAAGDVDALLAWSAMHPDNPPGLALCAQALLDAGRGAEALPLLEHSLELCPSLLGEDSAYQLLAQLHEESGDVERELEVLRRWIARDSDSLPARRRLMSLSLALSDWDGLLDGAQGALAIQPMLPRAHRATVTAAEALDRPAVLIRAAHALLALDPVDPARVHFSIARASAAMGDRETARIEVLRALEEAPRFREALDLLLELSGPMADDAERLRR